MQSSLFKQKLVSVKNTATEYTARAVGNTYLPEAIGTVVAVGQAISDKAQSLSKSASTTVGDKFGYEKVPTLIEKHQSADENTRLSPSSQNNYGTFGR